MAQDSILWVFLSFRGLLHQKGRGTGALVPHLDNVYECFTIRMCGEINFRIMNFDIVKCFPAVFVKLISPKITKPRIYEGWVDKQPKYVQIICL